MCYLLKKNDNEKLIHIDRWNKYVSAEKPENEFQINNWWSIIMEYFKHSALIRSRTALTSVYTKICFNEMAKIIT